MNIEEKVRNLAKSQYWQALYHSTKECSGINLFENHSNISGLQVLFLYWLRVYNVLYEELGNQEWTNLHERVISDNIHCDAFLYWRSKELEKRTREYKEDERKNRNNKGKTPDVEKEFSIYRGKKK